jgi:2-iminobutanoate/2-iminopropanoate deaminase
MDQEETILLTIVLKHDQSQNVDQIQGTLDEREWWARFPPQGCEVVSWTVAMGLGQIVTLRLPPRLLNVVNLEIERSAWGVFATDFYPTYDFVPVRERLKRQWMAQRSGAQS